VPFEDVRFAREQWPEMKKSMPFGQVPLLEARVWRAAASRLLPAASRPWPHMLQLRQHLGR
jgi:hypothetical protein